MTRRLILKWIGAAAASMTAATTGLVGISKAWADWNTAGFGAKKEADAIGSIGAEGAVETNQISFRAPDIAENGAVVPLEIRSSIPDTEAIAIVTERNPFPLTAVFNFENGADPFVETRIKMGASSIVKVYARAKGKYYVTSRNVKVTVGGCGG